MVSFYERQQYWDSSLAYVAVKFNYLNIHYLKTFRMGRMMDGRVNLATTGYGPFSITSRNQTQLLRIYFNIRSRFWFLFFWANNRDKIRKYNLTINWHLIFFLWKTAVLGQFSRISSSQIQLLKIHHLKTFRVGRVMDGPTTHWWRQDRDRFLVHEGIMSNEFKLIYTYISLFLITNFTKVQRSQQYNTYYYI